LQQWVKDANHLYQREKALWERDLDWEGFQWIDANDADNCIFTYLRFAKDKADCLVIACNFTPVVRSGYRIGVPAPGYYAELLNSDAAVYGGSNVGNGGGVQSEAVAWREWGHSVALTLPPLAIVVFKLRG
jgi:1,4-alpha-glucan branching enzyme